MKKPFPPPPAVQHTELAPTRDSFQTFASSDTATQYPRREVRSEWVAENKLEVAALEQYQEAIRDPNLSSQFDVAGSLQVSTSSRLVLKAAIGLALVASTGTGIALGVTENKNKNSPLDDVLVFSVEEFREVCENTPDDSLLILADAFLALKLVFA